MRQFLAILVSVTISIMPLDYSIATGSDGDQVHGTRAIPIKQPPAEWPRKLRYREGWVLVSFVISEEGRAERVVVEDSSGYLGFEEAAVDAVKHWEFEPATLGGKPVAQSKTQVRLVFAHDNPDGPDDLFNAEFTRAQRAINKNKIARAEKSVERLASRPRENLTEAAMLSFLRFRLAVLRNDEDEALRYLQRATTSNGRYIKPAFYSRLTAVEFPLLVKSGRYVEAIEAYDRLRDSEHGSAYIERLEPIYRKLILAIDADGPIRINARIGDRKHWSHDLLRNEFKLENVEGALARLDIRCTNHFAEYESISEQPWSVPEHWGKCRILVFGEEGASFDVLEYSAETSNPLTAIP